MQERSDLGGILIVFASEASQVRLELIEALHRLEKQSAEPLRILDVGGG